MREISIKLYKFSELSEKAQRQAWETGPNFSDDGSSDFRATLAAFEKIFDISVYRWSIDDWSYEFDYVTAGRATEAPEGDALRLARYIWNNYAEYIQKGRYYSTPGRYINGKYHYKYRYSKVTKEMDNCPLTGFFADQDILQPVIDCLHYKRFFDSYETLIDTCLDSFFRIWRADIEYHNSFEYFAETCEINEYEFYETGEMY
jgi:hypothetical protein